MSAALAIPERLEVVSGFLNDTGGRVAHWKVIGMIYLLCLVSQVLGDLYLSRYFLSKLNYTKCWIVAEDG